MSKQLIRDSQELIGAKTHYGYTIPVYDDSFGSLYISRNSIGINGIVRAQTWESAYEICEDEFFSEASETVAELEKEYGPDWIEDVCFQESYGFRPNGPNDRDTVKHGIYAKDLNGDYLDELTPALLAELEITLELNDPGEQYVCCTCCETTYAFQFCMLDDYSDADVPVRCDDCIEECTGFVTCVFNPKVERTGE